MAAYMNLVPIWIIGACMGAYMNLVVYSKIPPDERAYESIVALVVLYIHTIMRLFLTKQIVHHHLCRSLICIALLVCSGLGLCG